MIILEKPYVSEFLKKTAREHSWKVLENELSLVEENNFELIKSEDAKLRFQGIKNPLIYSNSENSITWILENIPESDLCRYIKLFKDKIAFRELLKEIYEDFYFQAIDFKKLKDLNPAEIKFPVVIKPAVGFLSFGVHTIKDQAEWEETLSILDEEMKLASSMYPGHVVDSSKFIIEEMIMGDEFAIDAYYDNNGEAVILNVFKHPFFDSKDVSDRIYIMSKAIMKEYMEKFKELLSKIGSLKSIKNFPMHIELRVTPVGEIIPIEINPMRFAGWCTTDVANYAWNINVYDYFLNQKRPDWDKILENSSDEIFYFSMAEVPSDINKSSIKSFDYEKFLANYSNILELRKIDYTSNPLFAVMFGSCKDEEEVGRILGLKTKDYINF